MRTFKQQLFDLRKAAAMERTPAAMATGYFDAGLEVKEPKSAAQMEKLIVDFMRLSGHQVQKVTTTGTYRDNRKRVTDVLGFERTIGTGQYVPGTSTKGASDIKATLAPSGLSLAIEVKFSKSDRQQPDQKVYQKDIEQAGGFYIIVRTLEDFLEQYTKILDHPKVKLLNSM